MSGIRFYQVAEQERFNKIRETIFRLDTTLEHLARTYRALSDGVVSDDITVPALNLVAGLSDNVEKLTGKRLINPDVLKTTESHHNLSILATQTLTEVKNNFNVLFRVRQRAMVNLVNLYRMWIKAQASKLTSSAPCRQLQDIDDKTVQQNEILKDLAILLPNETTTRFEYLPEKLVYGFKEVEDAVRALTLPDFADYFNELSANAKSALVNNDDFDLPKLNMEQMVGSKTTWETPHAIGYARIYLDIDEGGTFHAGFSDSDQMAIVKCGRISVADMVHAHTTFREIEKNVGKMLASSDLINGEEWINQLKVVAERSEMTPDEWLMYIYGDNLPSEPDQYEKSARYVGQLLSTEAALEYVYTMSRLVQVINFASPIIMNYCVTLSR